MRAVLILLLGIALPVVAEDVSVSSVVSPSAPMKPSDEVIEIEDMENYAPPSITIRGQKISSFSGGGVKGGDLLLPDSLKNPLFKKRLANKVEITPYKFSPTAGEAYAPIRIIEFMDLGCGNECSDVMQKLSKLQERHPGKVTLTHMYMPAKGDLDMVNFYGKIAQKEDVFWDYRTRILREGVGMAEAALSALLDLDVSRAAIRLAARRDAETFYRELDQERLLAEKLSLKKPPHLFINGVHVGEGGIPLDNLEDVILYELMLMKKNGIKY